MNDVAEQVGEAVASEITDAIAAANEQTQNAEAVADAIADAIIEGERGRRIETLENEMRECLANQSSLSEAMTGIALQLEATTGTLSTLQALLPSIAVPRDAEDGPRENQEVPEVIVVAEAPEPEAPAPEPEKPRRRNRFL